MNAALQTSFNDQPGGTEAGIPPQARLMQAERPPARPLSGAGRPRRRPGLSPPAKHDFIPAGTGRVAPRLHHPAGRTRMRTPPSLPVGTRRDPSGRGGEGARPCQQPRRPPKGSARGDRGGGGQRGGGVRGEPDSSGNWSGGGVGLRALGRLPTRGERTGRPSPGSRSRNPSAGCRQTPAEAFASGGEDAASHLPGPGGRREPHQPRLAAAVLSPERREQEVAKCPTANREPDYLGLMQSPCPLATGRWLAQL